MSAAQAYVASPRRAWLSLLVLAAVIAGLWFALRQSEELTFARKNLPAGCIATLAEMPAEDARTRGVALRDCARRKMPANRKANVVGRWVYGPSAAPVDGFLVWSRETLSDNRVRDRLMHVSVVESNAVLNEFDVAGTSCAGGINKVNLEGDSFGLVINLTPEALVRFLGSADVEKTWRDGDLITDPRYCVAKLVMVDRRPVVVQLNNRPVTANDTAVPAEVTAVMPRRQRCFDDQLDKRLARGETALSFPEGYNSFVADYAGYCAPPEPEPAAPPARKTRKSRR